VEQRFLIASLVSSLISLTSVVEIGHVSTGLQQDTAATALRLASRRLLTKATPRSVLELALLMMSEDLQETRTICLANSVPSASFVSDVSRQTLSHLRVGFYLSAS
jgi:hypothetical protein